MAKAARKIRLRAHKPWEMPDPDDAVIYALRAWASGTATDAQQKRAYEWVMFDACGLREMSFDPDNSRSTDFAEGARSVGLKITAAMKLPPKATLDPTKAGMLLKPLPKT